VQSAGLRRLRREQNFAAFNESYAKFFGDARPARSTAISALAHPDALVEVVNVAQWLRLTIAKVIAQRLSSGTATILASTVVWIHLR